MVAGREMRNLRQLHEDDADADLADVGDSKLINDEEIVGGQQHVSREVVILLDIRTALLDGPVSDGRECAVMARNTNRPMSIPLM
jgi:hypothetical protein